jgi:hypothetical protein
VKSSHSTCVLDVDGMGSDSSPPALAAKHCRLGRTWRGQERHQPRPCCPTQAAHLRSAGHPSCARRGRHLKSLNCDTTSLKRRVARKEVSSQRLKRWVKPIASAIRDASIPSYAHPGMNSPSPGPARPHPNQNLDGAKRKGARPTWNCEHAPCSRISETAVVHGGGRHRTSRQLRLPTRPRRVGRRGGEGGVVHLIEADCVLPWPFRLRMCSADAELMRASSMVTRLQPAQGDPAHEMLKRHWSIQQLRREQVVVAHANRPLICADRAPP